MLCTSLVPPTPSHSFISTQAHRNISLIRRRDVQQQPPRRLIRQSVTRATSSQAVIRRQELAWAKGPGSIFLCAPYSVQQPPNGMPLLCTQNKPISSPIILSRSRHHRLLLLLSAISILSSVCVRGRRILAHIRSRRLRRQRQWRGRDVTRTHQRLRRINEQSAWHVDDENIDFSADD